LRDILHLLKKIILDILIPSNAQTNNAS
jgi:hypothetical protein